MTVFSWLKQMSAKLHGLISWIREKGYLRRSTTIAPRLGIRLYQHTVSPDHSKLGKLMYPYGYCKFYPSCSEYCHQCLSKYGLLRGSWRSIGRLFRCNPWHNGGIDLP